MPDLAAFEVLLAVARGASLSAAARELGLTQQAVSSRIASLEARTGVRLVTRTTRGSELTPSGIVVAQWADRLLRVADEVDTGLASLRQSSRDRVRVSASLTVAEQLLPGWLVTLQAAATARGEAAPDVVLTATNSDHVITAVRDGSADLGFVEGPRAPRGLRSRVVAHDDLVLVARPDHPLTRRRTPIGAVELAATPLVVREAGSGTRDALTAALTVALGPDTVQAPPILELSTAAAVRGAVLAGAGPAVVSRLTVADDLALGRLRRIPIADVDLERDLRAVWTGGRTPPAGAARDLLAHIAVSGNSGRDRA